MALPSVCTYGNYDAVVLTCLVMDNMCCVWSPVDSYSDSIVHAPCGIDHTHTQPQRNVLQDPARIFSPLGMLVYELTIAIKNRKKQSDVIIAKVKGWAE